MGVVLDRSVNPYPDKSGQVEQVPLSNTGIQSTAISLRKSGPVASDAANVGIGFLEGGTVAHDPYATQQSHSRQGAIDVSSPQCAI